MLALLIPRKESVTSGNVDVYLAPLIEELQQLWEDVDVVDAYAESVNRNFRLIAMGFCTEYMQHYCESEHCVWDNKEELAMNSEVIEGNGRHRLLPDELCFWIHEFVLNNAEPLQVSESKSTYFVLLPL